MSTADYDERLYAPTSWWLVGLVGVISVGWVFFVATPIGVAAAATAVCAVVVTAALLRFGAARITVDAAGLHAGRAVLLWQYVGAVSVLDREAARRAIGTDADARAYLMIRPYCSAAVTVGVADERDPTPYWLLSTRCPQRLAERLRARIVQD